MSNSFNSSTQLAALQKSIWICRRCAEKLAARHYDYEFSNYATCGFCRGKTSVAVQNSKSQ